MVGDAVVSCCAALRDLKRVAMFPEGATLNIRSSDIKNIFWIRPGECVELTSILVVFASILTAPQPLFGEEVSDFVPVPVFASSHTATGWLEQVRKKIIAHFGARAEEGCYLL